MKPCKLTLDGQRYWVNSYGVVLKLTVDELGMAGVETGNICDEAESEKVLTEVARLRRNLARRVRHEAMTSIGLKRVKGALGGTYYE